MPPKAAVVVLAATLLLVPAAAFSAAALPPAPVIPQVRVEIDTVPPVDVNRDEETVVTVNGTVNVTAPPCCSVATNVYLNVTINNTFWLATIDPPSASFTGSAEVAFKVNVSVPGRASFNAGAEIFVDANVSVSGVGRSWTATTPLPVLQYFGVAITSSTSSSPTNFTAPGGADTGFSFRIQNLGNGADAFEIRLENIGELQASGISVFIPTPVSVPSKVTANVNGNITVPATLTSGNFTLAIVALSTGAAAKGETLTAAGEKHMRVVPPEDGGNGGGGGGGGGGTDQNGTGFLPGASAAMALAATAGAAVMASWRRLRRP